MSSTRPPPADPIAEGLTHPEHHAQYYYNLGTLYAQKSQTGAARGYLEAAHYLSPFDSDIRANLDSVRAQTQATNELGGWDETIEAFTHPLALSAEYLLALIIGVFAIVKWIRNSRARATWIWSGVALATLAIAFAFNLLSAQESAAALLEDTMVRSGPGDSYLDLTQLWSGSRLHALSRVRADTSGTLWRMVRFRGREVGWLPESKLLLFNGKPIRGKE